MKIDFDALCELSFKAREPLYSAAGGKQSLTLFLFWKIAGVIIIICYYHCTDQEVAVLDLDKSGL